MTGHADFAEHGKDLVCAAASAVSFGAVNSVYTLTQTEPDVDIGNDGGHLSVRLPDPEDESVQLILKSMIVSLQTIERDYGEHIKVTFNR